jgi:hypothetical protein
VVLASRRYLPSSEGLIQEVYSALGGDMKGFLRLLTTMQKSKEPRHRLLERWLHERLALPSE